MSRHRICLGALSCLTFASVLPALAEPPARTDLYGDPLPARALARLGTLRWCHGSRVTHVAFLPDGKGLLTACEDGTVRLWDPQTGREIRRFAGKTGLSVGGSWKLLVDVVPWSGGAGGGVALSPDGKVLAIPGGDNRIQLLDVATGKEILTIRMTTIGIYALLFSPDGKTLAVRGHEQAITLWDTATGKELREIRSRGKDSDRVGFFSADGTTIEAFSGDGRSLAVGGYVEDKGKLFPAVGRWETATGKEFPPIRLAGTQMVSALAYAPDGKILAYANAGAIRLCEASTGKERGQLEDKFPRVSALVFAPDGKALAVKGVEGTIYLYDPETGKSLRRLPDEANRIAEPITVHSSGATVQTVAFSPDGKWIAVPSGRRVRIVEAASGKDLVQDLGSRGSVAALQWLSGGKRVASKGADDTIRLWEAATGKERQRFKVPPSTTCVAIAPDGRTAATADDWDSLIRLHETATGKELHQFPGHKSGTAAVAFSSDGQTLASRGCVDNAIRLWAAASGKVIREIAIQPGIAPGKPEGGRPLMGGEAGAGLGLEFAPDGKTLASPVKRDAVSSTLNVWDATTGKLVRVIELPHQHGFASFTFSPDGRTLATENADHTVTLWEVASGKERGHLGKSPAPDVIVGEFFVPHPFSGLGRIAVSTIAFSPDGRTLVARGPDAAIRLWDVAAAGVLAELKGHDGVVSAVAMAPDGKTLATGASDTTILVWDLTRWGPQPRPPAVELHVKEVEALWADLAGGDAPKAWQGIQKLAGAPEQAMALFRGRLRPAAAADAKKIAKWIADLDSDDFATRQRAEQELEKLGDLAGPALTRLRAEPPSAETKRRAERLLEKMRLPILSAEHLRLVRAVAVLEQVGTAEARRLLEELSKGAPGALPTREAQAALDRLARQSPAKP